MNEILTGWLALFNVHVRKQATDTQRNMQLSIEIPNTYWRFDEASLMVATHQAKVSFILKWSNSGRVLDLGCNDGGIADRIRQSGAFVIAADQGLYANVARSKYGLPAVALDANRLLPFADATFDVVVVSGLLEYLNAPEDLLAEIRRILNPAGRLVLIAPNRDSMRHKYRQLKGLPPLPEARFSLIELRHILGKAGFAIRICNGCAHRPSTLRGQLIYILESCLPKYVTDFAFVCDISHAVARA